jgi:curved DNA binding protein
MNIYIKMEEKDYFEQLEDSNTLEKYKVGGIIVTNVINGILNNVKPEESLNKLYELGYNLYNKEINKYFNKKKLVNGKGLSFPLSLSLNNVAGYYINRDVSILLKEGDILKIDFGVHIDGYPSVACITKLVTNNIEECDKNKLKLIDVLNEAKNEALKLIKPESTNKEFVKKMEKVVKKYGFNLLTCNGQHEKAPGVISYQMSQNIIDGKNDGDTENVHKLILLRGNDTFDFELFETEFEENEVYAIDIGISTGSGKMSKLDNTTNIYKRNNDIFYSLKMKASKKTLSNIKGYFPLDVSKISNPRFKFGLNECLKNKLIEEYPVMAEKDNHIIGRIKFTVIIRRKTKKNKKGNILITNIDSI